MQRHMDPQAIPTLRYRPSAQQLPHVQRSTSKEALKQYGYMAKLIETEVAYEPVILDRGDYIAIPDADNRKLLYNEALTVKIHSGSLFLTQK